MKKILFLSSLCFHFFSFSQCYQDSLSCCEVYNSLLRKAEQKLEQGDLKKSILIYEKAHCIRPNDQKVICRLEELYLEKERILNSK
jgi:hypothetical protein